MDEEVGPWDEGDEEAEEDEEEEEEEWVAPLGPLGQQLIDAAIQGIIERVGALLDQGVAVDSRDGDEWTPLMEASHRGYRAVAALLLDRGASVNAEDDGGMTPATCATLGGHLDTLQLLVSRGADIHHIAQYTGRSSLLWAALFDQLPICEYLLSLGADLMVVDNFNQTALAHYGDRANNFNGLIPETKTLRVAALEAAWAAGPHPSQVQRWARRGPHPRRRDERWARRGPLITVLAEHAYHPLQLRAQAIAAAAVGAPLPLLVHSAKEVVLRHEGLARLIISYL